MSIRQTHSEVGLSEVEKFLNSGWVFSLGSGELALGWGEGEWQTLAPMDAASIYAPDFYLTSAQPWRTTEFFAVTTPQRLRALLIEGSPGDAIPKVKWEEPPFADFQRIFAYLKSAFQTGEAQKAVPAVFARSVGPVENERLRAALIAGLGVPDPLRIYGVWTSTEGILGLTPEVLFQIQNRHLSTMALAGTRRGVLSEAEERAFLSDSKERHEHQLVINDIQDRLSGLAEVSVGTTGVLQLPTLAHLFTPIEAELAWDIEFSDTVRKLHPTAALGVMPRRLGLEWMRTWDQPETRRRYGAPFGMQARISGAWVRDCLVAIRNFQWQDAANQRRWVLGAGCGLVPQSELENEWKELAAKRDSVCKLLGL